MDGPAEIKGDPFIYQRLLSSAFVIIAFDFYANGLMKFDTKMTLIGISGGLMLGSLMWVVSRAVQKGPAAFTFAVLNSACIVPPLVMAILFGEVFGHQYSLKNGLGGLIVVAGLLWMGLGSKEKRPSISWFYWLTLAFAIHVCYLSFFQWRALLFKIETPLTFLIPFRCDADSANCFTLWMFLTAATFQICLPKNVSNIRLPKRNLLIFGICGGLINGIGSYFMLRSTVAAELPEEKALVFPLYCVLLITLCNLWGRLLYQEKINWYASGLTMFGIIIGMA